MNYFDDLNVPFVGRKISSLDSTCIGGHDYYGLGIMNGKDQVLRALPGNNVRVQMPFVYLIHPSERSGWMAADGAQRDNRWFIVEGPRAEWFVSSLKELFDEPTYTRQLKNYSELIVLHQNMLQLYHSSGPAKNYRLRIYVENFIGALYDALESPDLHAPMQELICKTAQMITENPGADFDFESIAKEFNISFDHFRRCFTEFTGVPLHEFVLQKRFALAVSLLKSGTLSIKEISYNCGFQNSSDFARFIKKRSSSTPSELRKQPQFMEI